MTSKNLEGKSKVVGVVGSSGGVGQHVTEELLIAGDFKVVLLLRKKNDELINNLHATTSSTGTNERLSHEIVDFTNNDQLKQVIENNSIDTIVSGGFSFDGSHQVTEHTLIDASVSSGIVRRFCFSSWALPSEICGIELYKGRNKTYQKLRALSDKISFTTINTGIFMNYLGTNAEPRPDNHYPGVKPTLPGNAHLQPLNYVINPSEAKADIPGTGDEQFVMTSIQDVGRYVVDACRLSKVWDESIGFIAGDVTSYNKIVQIFETKINPRRKFQVNYVPFSYYRETADEHRGKSVLQTFYAEAQLAFENRKACLWEDAMRRDINFKPTTVEQFIKEWWDKPE